MVSDERRAELELFVALTAKIHAIWPPVGRDRLLNCLLGGMDEPIFSDAKDQKTLMGNTRLLLMHPAILVRDYNLDKVIIRKLIARISLDFSPSTVLRICIGWECEMHPVVQSGFFLLEESQLDKHMPLVVKSNRMIRSPPEFFAAYHAKH